MVAVAGELSRSQELTAGEFQKAKEAIEALLHSQFDKLDALTDAHTSKKLSDEQFRNESEALLREALLENSTMLGVVFKLLEGKSSTKESQELRITVLLAQEVMYRMAEKLGFKVGLAILDEPQHQVTSANRVEGVAKTEPPVVNSWQLDKQKGTLTIAGVTFPQEQFKTANRVYIKDDLRTYHSLEVDFSMSDADYSRLLAEVHQYRTDVRQNQVPAQTGTETPAAEAKNPLRLAVEYFIRNENEGTVTLRDGSGQAITVPWQEQMTVLKKKTRSADFLLYDLVREPSKEVVTVRVPFVVHRQLSSACAEMGAVDWHTLVFAYKNEPNVSGVIAGLQSQIAKGVLAEHKACIELQEKMRAQIFTPAQVREKFPSLSYDTVKKIAEHARAQRIQSAPWVARAPVVEQQKVVDASGSTQYAGVHTVEAGGMSAHASHDRTGSKVEKLPDGSKKGRFVVVDGSGGSLDEIWPKLTQPEKDALIGRKMDVFVEAALNTPGKLTDVHLKAANEVKPSAMRQRDGRENLAYGVGAIMDVNHRGLSFVTQGDTAVLLFNPDGDFATRRSSKAFQDNNLGNPSRFQQLNKPDNLAALLKDGSPYESITGLLDVATGANQVMRTFGDEKVAPTTEHTYSQAELKQMGARYALIVTDGAEPNAITDSNHVENERIAKLLLRSVNDLSVRTQLPPQYRSISPDLAQIEGEFLLQQIKYQKEVVLIMEGLSRGEYNLTEASKKIATASRTILKDEDDITVQIVDLADFMPALKKQ